MLLYVCKIVYQRVSSITLPLLLACSLLEETLHEVMLAISTLEVTLMCCASTVILRDCIWQRTYHVTGIDKPLRFIRSQKKLSVSSGAVIVNVSACYAGVSQKVPFPLRPSPKSCNQRYYFDV